MSNVEIQYRLEGSGILCKSDRPPTYAIRDITAALEAKALQHNITKRFSLSEVAAAHEAQDSGKLGGKAIIEVQ